MRVSAAAANFCHYSWMRSEPVMACVNLQPAKYFNMMKYSCILSSVSYICLDRMSFMENKTSLSSHRAA